jgi:hypothetical protein
VRDDHVVGDVGHVGIQAPGERRRHQQQVDAATGVESAAGVDAQHADAPWSSAVVDDVPKSSLSSSTV